MLAGRRKTDKKSDLEAYIARYGHGLNLPKPQIRRKKKLTIGCMQHIWLMGVGGSQRYEP